MKSEMQIHCTVFLLVRQSYCVFQLVIIILYGVPPTDYHLKRDCNTPGVIPLASLPRLRDHKATTILIDHVGDNIHHGITPLGSFISKDG